MYGVIVKLTANPGARDTLIATLLEGAANMPGCISYAIARDANDADTIWITETWQDETSHSAGLQLPSVRNSMARARPLIAGMVRVATTEPVGGHGRA